LAVADMTSGVLNVLRNVLLQNPGMIGQNRL
jgi:hypothetical protein